MREQVTKAWYVEGYVADPVKGKRKITSRDYHVRDAANEYADQLRESGVCIPNTVNVRTRKGHDKIDNEAF